MYAHTKTLTCKHMYTHACTVIICSLTTHTNTIHTQTHIYWPSWEASGSTCDDRGHTYHTAAFSQHRPCGDRCGSEPEGQSDPTWCSCPVQQGEEKPATDWCCPAPTLPSDRRYPAVDVLCLACLWTRQFKNSWWLWSCNCWNTSYK